MPFRSALPLLAALGVAGCATPGRVAPVEVTRFDAGRPIAPGTVAPEPGIMSLEASSYRDAALRELDRLGFRTAAPGVPARYLVSIGVDSDTRERLARRSPVSIGIGGGTGGWGSGVGVGASFGVGGGGPREVQLTRLSVQLRERGGPTVWEGRAQVETRAGRPESDLRTLSGRLAEALFRDFPGQSGRTIEVR